MSEKEEKRSCATCRYSTRDGHPDHGPQCFPCATHYLATGVPYTYWRRGEK
jgi:hypothetical protein